MNPQNGNQANLKKFSFWNFWNDQRSKYSNAIPVYSVYCVHWQIWLICIFLRTSLIEDPPPGPRLLPTDIVSTTTMVKSWIWGQERLKTYITASNSFLIDSSRIFQEFFIVSQSFQSCLSFAKRSSNQIPFCQKVSHQTINERSVFILRRDSIRADQWSVAV